MNDEQPPRDPGNTPIEELVEALFEEELAEIKKLLEEEK